MRTLQAVAMTVTLALSSAAISDEANTMNVPMQKQQKVEFNGKVSWTREERMAVWDPHQTAIIVCDMWDKHWCPNAEKRVAELTGPMNEVLKAARKQGVFVIHAPSTTMEFYENTPQRKRAKSASFAKTPVPLSTKERFGTCWCYLDKDREAELPIDDSDMGCDCEEKYEPHDPWTRQIAAIEIADEDAITDDGQETWNLLQERGIDHVILMGVHLNMCVLGREFGIRQFTYLGKNVVLMRDMTDTMYNPKMPPEGQPFRGDRPDGRPRREILVPDDRQHRLHRQTGVPIQG